MCIEEKLPSDFRETLTKFKDCFNKLYDNFHLNMTLKIHVIFHHYEEYFETTGTNFRTTNGEHHEAVHHSLKVFERKKGFHQQKKWAPFYTSRSLFCQFHASMFSGLDLCLKTSSVSKRGKELNLNHLLVLVHPHLLLRSQL